VTKRPWPWRVHCPLPRRNFVQREEEEDKKGTFFKGTSATEFVEWNNWESMKENRERVGKVSFSGIYSLRPHLNSLFFTASATTATK